MESPSKRDSAAARNMLKKRGAYPKSDMFCQGANLDKGARTDQVGSANLRIAHTEQGRQSAFLRSRERAIISGFGFGFGYA